MRECSSPGLQGLSCLFPILGYWQGVLFSLEGSSGLIDLTLECRDAGLCRVQLFDGFDRKFYKSHAVSNNWDDQYSSASMIVSTQRAIAGSFGVVECLSRSAS